MSKIYCVYCGKENDSQNKKCEKCKKELNPKEHLWKDYFYGKAKGKVEGETKKSLFKLFINYIKSHLYGIAISLSFIITTITGIQAITNDNYIQNVTEKPIFEVAEEIKLVGCWHATGPFYNDYLIFDKNLEGRSYLDSKPTFIYEIRKEEKEGNLEYRLRKTSISMGSWDEAAIIWLSDDEFQYATNIIYTKVDCESLPNRR